MGLVDSAKMDKYAAKKSGNHIEILKLLFYYLTNEIHLQDVLVEVGYTHMKAGVYVKLCLLVFVTYDQLISC